MGAQAERAFPENAAPTLALAVTGKTTFSKCQTSPRGFPPCALCSGRPAAEVAAAHYVRLDGLDLVVDFGGSRIFHGHCDDVGF